MVFAGYTAAFGFAQQTSDEPVPAADQSQNESELADESLMLFDDEPDPTLDQTQDAIETGGLWDWVRMIVVLALVLAMIYAVVWFLKRIQQPRRPETSLIDIAASQTLSGSRSVHLIRVGQQVFLVGEAENAVQLVSEITNQESLDEIRLKAPLERSNAAKSFSELLAGMLKPRPDQNNDENQAVAQSEPPSLDFIQNRRERLKDM